MLATPSSNMLLESLDDQLLAGPSAEVARCIVHVKSMMPMVGLSFSTQQKIPAAGLAHQINIGSFTALGCTIQEDGNFEVVK